MNEELLDVYPVHAMEFELKDGIVTLLYINPNPNYFEKTFFKEKLNKPKKIDLDDVGSFVWTKCNGETKVSEIIELVQKEFGEKVKDAKERVTLFINQLNRNHLINLFKKEIV